MLLADLGAEVIEVENYDSLGLAKRNWGCPKRHDCLLLQHK